MRKYRKALLMMLLFLFSSSAVADSIPEYAAIRELEGKTIGYNVGTVDDLTVKNQIPETKSLYFNSLTDRLAALESGKIDATIGGEPAMRRAMRQHPNLAVIPEALAYSDYGFAFAKGSPLTSEFDEILREMERDGTLSAAWEKWVVSDSAEKDMPPQTWPGKNGVLRYWTRSDSEPICYIGENNRVMGYEPEILLRIAEKLDMRVEITTANFDALMPSLQTRKSDVVSGHMSMTAERREILDFSYPAYREPLVALVRAKDDGAQKAGGFFSELTQSFNRTFIKEGRYRLIFSGLGITVLLSVLSCIVGLAFGFFLCMIRRSRFKPGQVFAAVFVRIVQGTPIVVLLMILYYVIFGKVNISGIIVSVIGFSVNFGAYSSEMIRSGIEAVPAGQAEAGLALGYTPLQCFWKIIFPQAAVHFIPVLKGEFISLVKMTSVVGYIAVQDLTKVTDIIRSRTMEAFFPLIVTAVIYFALANVFTFAISGLERKVDHKKRKNKKA
ncbi:MAG: ABC transporter permease subunit [Clostridia bacterium]|nr:ABC transporter permease subunit [Clostridia bacterium]